MTRPAHLPRAAVLAYALAAYALVLGACAALAGFLLGLGWPRGVDTGPVVPVREALARDLALLALFGVQHSVMARRRFKRAVARLVPAPVERATYVVASSAALLALVAWWLPIPGVVWSVDREPLALAVRAVGALGLALVVWATFQIDHAELLGLRQAWAFARGRPPARDAFATPLLYRIVRHPMQLGFLAAFWAAPVMSVGRLLLAAAMTAYVLVGVWYEERDLERAFGERYRAYRRDVPGLLPLGGAARGGAPRLALLLAGLAPLAVASLTPAARDGAPGVHRRRVEAAGLERSYTVYVPRRLAPRPAVVIALHGARQDGALMRAVVGRDLERLADERGFLVAYPDGWERTWNDCRRGAPYPAKRARVDDVAFVRALVAELRDAHRADPGRVRALGFSNGAQLALRLALEAPDAVQGVAAFGAGLPVPEELDCAPSRRPVSVLLVSGTADPINPHEGGAVLTPTGVPIGHVRSARATAAYFTGLGGRVALEVVPGGGHDPFVRTALGAHTSFDGVAAAVRFLLDDRVSGPAAVD